MTLHDRLAIWSPTAERIDLVRNDPVRNDPVRNDPVRSEARQPLRQDGDWFHLDEPLADGERYALSLDGGDPLPDPRSPYQPDGVHAASAHVDHRRFPWTDTGFAPVPLGEAVIYELHVGCFTGEGTFDAAIGRLDHLVDLGITHVEVMPVAAFPGRRGWGYDGVALYAVHEAYGGPDSMKRFVDACHARGLAVILDVVYNHLGPEGNYLARFGPYFSWKHRTPWGSAFNLDEPQAHEVRAFLCDNAASWIRDYHVDGLRLDATHALHDSSALPLLEQLGLAAEEAGRARGIHPQLIAEHLANDPRVARPRDEHGLGMAAQWCDDFHDALTAALTDERRGHLVDFGGLRPLARCLERGWYFEGQQSLYRARRHGRPFGDAERPGHRLISYAQNHDQIGNRGQGDRLAARTSLDRVKIAAAVTLLGPGVPMLFMGEEWAASSPFLFFTDFEDRRLQRDVEKGRRRELADKGFEDSPSPGAESTFRRSVLDWDERDQTDPANMLAWYRALIALRRAEPALHGGELARVRHGEDWLAMQRGEWVLAFNLGEARALPIDAGQPPVLSSVEVEGVTLPRDTVALWRDARVTEEG